MKKRNTLFALLMAVVLVLSVSVTAFADDDIIYDESAYDDSSYTDPNDDYDYTESSDTGKYAGQDLYDEGTNGEYKGFFGDNDDINNLSPDGDDSTDYNNYSDDSNNYSDNNNNYSDDNTESSSSESSAAEATEAPSATATPKATVTPSPKTSASPKASASPEASKGDNYQTIGQIKNHKSSVSSFSILGIVLLVVGVVGILAVIIWSIASKSRDRREDEEIYETVGNASRENGGNNQSRRGGDPYSYDDNYAYVSAKGRTAQRPVKQQRNPNAQAQGQNRPQRTNSDGSVRPSAAVNGRRPGQANGNNANRQAQQRNAQRPTQNRAPQQRPTQQRAPKRDISTYDTKDIDALLDDVLKDDK